MAEILDFVEIFRMWSLLDGIEPVENMNRCMSNNWTCRDFGNHGIAHLIAG